MKKKYLIFIEIISLLFICLTGFVGCNKTIKYDLNFIVDQKVYATISTTGNEMISMPEDPTKTNYIFDGWYWDNYTFNIPFTFNSLLNQPLSSDMKVYAKWIRDNNNYNDTNITHPQTNNPKIEIDVYIDNEKSETLYTSSTQNYTIDLPQKPEDITTNVNSEKYFYGWFMDNSYQTPVLETTQFMSDSKIYGKWIDVYLNNYQYSVNQGKAAITKFTNRYNSTIIVIPANINSFPVETINDDVFKNNTLLRTVIICDGIKKINCRAFYGCNSMTNIILPDSITTIGAGAFYGCNSMTNIILPDSITTIGAGAFWGCSSLTSMMLSNNITSIGKGAFGGCSGLTKITLPFIGDKPRKSTDTYQYPFGYIFGTESYTGGTRTRQSYCENSKNTITEYVIPTSLKEVIITGSSYITDYAFYHCCNITSVVIPNSVTSIGNLAFGGCKNLTSISVDNKNTIYDSRGNCNAIIETATNTLIFGCNNTIIPNSVTSIGKSAFSGCGITSITIPNSVTSIGDSVFYDCSSLIYNEYDNAYYLGNDINKCLVLVTVKNHFIKSCNVSNNTKIICMYAFCNCKQLTSVTIPSSVTIIAQKAFIYCDKLKIYATVGSKPNGWADGWCDCTVYWNS